MLSTSEYPGYRDKTWCGYRDCADWLGCPDALTDGLLRRAEDAEIPVARYAQIPPCYRIDSWCEPEITGA